MGNKAGRRNTGRSGGRKRSKGKHVGAPSQSRSGNKRIVRAEKRVLERVFLPDAS